MATVVTRTLVGKDVFERIAIKEDGEQYNKAGQEKWGILTVSLTSYAITGTPDADNKCRVDIRPSNYHPDTDNIIVDYAQHTSNPGTVAIDKTYKFAINKGVPGPAVRIQPDGSWDLIDVIFETVFGSTVSLTLTVTYTLAFEDLTPA